jgi:hypothetical protein
MAIQREKDVSLGYARDFVEVVRSLIPFWLKGCRVKIVTNAGGLNPIGCAEACNKVLMEAGLTLQIGVVSGDDVLPLLKADPTHSSFSHLETQESLQNIYNDLSTANAYLGAAPIAEALRQGADIVITGRTADPSLTVGPCLAHYGWSASDFDRIAGATIAGHLLECGTQVTGGICTHWLEVEDPVHLGFPIAEIFENGSCILTKPEGTGGEVSIRTVKEQLLYEIGDPARYLSPDALVSFLELQLEEVGKDRIRVSGAKGSSPPSTYKVSATYRAGYKVEGTLAIVGREVLKKAEKCGEIILQRLREAGYHLDKTLIECLGGGSVVPGIFPPPLDLRECILRIAAFDRQKEGLEYLAKEFAPLVTSGPQGVTGYISGRPSVRQVFGYWPCLVNVTHVYPKITVLKNKDEA